MRRLSLVVALTLLCSRTRRHRPSPRADPRKEGANLLDASLAGDITPQEGGHRRRAARMRPVPLSASSARSATSAAIRSSRCGRSSSSPGPEGDARPPLPPRRALLRGIARLLLPGEPEGRRPDPGAPDQGPPRAGEGQEGEGHPARAARRLRPSGRATSTRRSSSATRTIPAPTRVLYFLGHNLMDLGEEKKGLVAYRKLIETFPKSRFVPDAHLPSASTTSTTARGSASSSPARSSPIRTRPASPRARSTASRSTSRAGATSTSPTTPGRWTCSRRWSSTVSSPAPPPWRSRGGTKGKNALIREARNDYVRAYERCRPAGQEAKENFSTGRLLAPTTASR